MPLMKALKYSSLASCSFKHVNFTNHLIFLILVSIYFQGSLQLSLTPASTFTGLSWMEPLKGGHLRSTFSSWNRTCPVKREKNLRARKPQQRQTSRLLFQRLERRQLDEKRKRDKRLILGAIQRNRYSRIFLRRMEPERKTFKLKSIHRMQY